MSGHSKWSTIKRKKGAADARRGKVFTKLIREIATAASLAGPDPAANPRLRLVMEKARASNMPKDNIERAIKKGTGASDGQAYQEAVYEGYGPGGTAILIETLTDNKNRTVGEVRHVLSKHGGNLGASGCVSYLFEKKGWFVFDRAGLDLERLFEVALEAGAEDVVEGQDSIDVITAVSDFERVRDALAEHGLQPLSGEVTMQPASTVSLQGKQVEQMLHLADALDDLDDVQHVHSNFDIPEEEMAKLA
jgi:YebC/PmpR family DNA-binding regulatory protein